MRTGNITLDECLFCNVIKIVYYDKTESNQSVENAGVAFFKEADERNKFFKKQTISNVRRTSAGEEGKGLTISGTN